jgi:UDP-N-acetylmuramoyl-tripeptide--D-alanyl-D-alanine ligase
MKTDQLYQVFKESSGITTDSRSVSKGSLFFALWGENYNGNKFAAEALEKGASWAVIDDPLFESEKTILVDDCLLELQALAAHHRKMLNIPVLAITGTNGKTTTKELIASIVSRKLKVHYTKGNLNNHIGVPLTILSAPEDTQLLIIEMGASHVGEIRTLCQIARPDYGIITNIGNAHIEGFGSFDGVVRAKTELYDFLKKVNGIALYNDKNALLSEKIFKMVNRAVPYSDPTGIDLVVEQIPSDFCLSVAVTYHHKTYNIKTNLFGKYNLENVKAAIATALFLGVEMDVIADEVSKFIPANNRSQVKKTNTNTLICDSYNANPTSMQMAIDSFVKLNADNKVFILGDMLELGEKSEEEHMNIINLLSSLKDIDVFFIGPQFQKACEKSTSKSFQSIDMFIEHIKEKPISKSTILIKGSRGIGLEKTYDFL